MKRQYGVLFLVTVGLSLILGAGCDSATVENMATTQAESFNALQQEVTDLATAQAGSFSVLQDAAGAQAEVMGEVQQDVRAVATAVADQNATQEESILITEFLAQGVGLLWRQAGSDENLPLDLMPDKSFHYDDSNPFFDEWLRNGNVLFIWQQTTSTDPEDSLDEVQGNLFYSETLLSEALTAAGEGDIQLVELQNILFLTSSDSEPVPLVRGTPQEIVDARSLQQTTTLESAFAEAGFTSLDQIDHLLILLESEDTSGDGQPQLILLTLEIPPAGGPDPGDFDCRQYCSQCYKGICQPVCWACGVFR